MKRNNHTGEMDIQTPSGLVSDKPFGFEGELRENRFAGDKLADHGEHFFAPDDRAPAELPLSDDEQPATPESPDEDAGGQSPDDTLGLYLRQMGAIPLLNRKEELELAQRLETARNRYRHAALSSRQVLRRVVETFERVQAGTLPLDPTIDVATSLGLSRENILARMPYNLRTLRI
jgi:RNA polymerase primary sigma factor